MKELAIKHKEYLIRAKAYNTAPDGGLNTQLTQVYIRETGRRVNGSCPSCFINQIVPEYLKLLKD